MMSRITNKLKFNIKRRAALLALVFVLLASVGGSPAQAGIAAQRAGRYYPQTGKTLAPEFVSYYDAKGGVALFGYPLTDAETEGGLEVQYLERARIEYHPENRGTQYEVQLGLLGNVVTAGRQFASAPASLRATGSSRVYFGETGHTLAAPFLLYWQRNGGLALFGYPISEPLTEGGVTVQYFERNRFEYHPENAGTAYEVLLGLLGRDLLAQRVQVSEAQVTLPVYGYEAGFYNTPGDAIDPYPHLNLDLVAAPSLRNYRLIVLENRYLRLSVMPELGGRLYEVIYKPTGHDELYRNPVIKPSHFGTRGWWLGAGGTEWAAPTDEHGLMEYLPWESTVTRDNKGGATVTVSATDRLTGMKVTVAITLGSEESLYSVSPRIENSTDAQKIGQLWSNAMLSPGGTNRAEGSTKFIVPTNQMTVHSTNDATIPPAHGVISWPRQDGRDLSDVATWTSWLGAFALPSPQRGSFAAVYNSDADEGMVKTFAGAEMPGLKIFGFGPGFDKSTYTDGDSSYVELWGGITPTFWDNATFPPNSALGWTERWQPVAGTGGVGLSGAWGTVSHSDGVVSLLPTRRIEGATLVVRGAAGETRTLFSAMPDHPAQVPYEGAVSKVEVLAPNGKTLLEGELVGR